MTSEVQDQTAQHTRKVVRAAKLMVLVGWILIPLVYLLLQQFVSLVGWVAFGVGVLQLLAATIKFFGNPDRWIPGHKARKDREDRHAHFIYHCERNPEGFARLRQENWERAQTPRGEDKPN